MRKLFLTLCASILLVSASPIHAKVAKEFYDDMHHMCRDTNINSVTVHITSCYQYIRGFLQGALITDTVIVEEVGIESFAGGFENRAYRTRVGVERNKQPATRFAGFCLPNNQVNHDVVTNLMADVQVALKNDTEIEHKLLLEYVYHFLTQRYSCDSQPNSIS